MEDIYCVYKITGPNGKIEIMAANRVADHIHFLQYLSNPLSNYEFHRDLAKMGPQNFKFETLATVPTPAEVKILADMIYSNVATDKLYNFGSDKQIKKDKKKKKKGITR